MKSLSCAKPLLAAALVIGGLAATSAAHARSDVHFSIGLNAPIGYVQPAPVYVQPQPVYVQPQPVYGQPQPIYYQNSHRGHRSGPWGDADRDGVPNAYDRHYDGRGGYRSHGWRDADRDGVPNRYDHAPRNPYRY
jgi:hypothetical protein